MNLLSDAIYYLNCFSRRFDTTVDKPEYTVYKAS